MRTNLSTNLLFCFAAIWLYSGCQKEPFGDIKPFVGTWQIVSLQTQTFDVQGNKITDVTKTDIGDAEIKADGEKGSFNPIIFDPQLGAFKPIATVVSAAAGSTATNGRSAIYFSPDIDNDRINFWGIGPGSSISDIGTILKFDNKELHLAAVETFAGSANTTNTPTLRQMQTLIMKKR